MRQYLIQLPRPATLLALLVLHAFVGDSAWAKCSAGQVTRLVTSCAASWEPSGSKDSADLFNPWPYRLPAEARVSPDTDMKQRFPLTRANCPGDMSIVNVSESDHMALVACKEGTGPARAGVYLNLDYLDCQDRNAREQAASRKVPETPQSSCPGEPFGSGIAKSAMPGGSALEDAQRFQESLLSDIQRERLERLREMARTTQRTVRSDLSAIVGDYKKLSREDRSAWLDRSRERLSGFVGRATAPVGSGGYGADCDLPANSADPRVVRGQRTCRLLKRALESVEGLVALAPGDLDAELERLAQDSAVAGGQSLSVRMGLFHGYAVADQDALVRDGRLSFARNVTELGGIPFRELHDGYVFGGSRLGTLSGGGRDCSDLSMAMMRNGIDAPPTRVLKGIARKLLKEPGGEQPLPDAWSGFANCFEAVDLRAPGARPRTLDLVISRVEHVNHGHVVVVDSFDPATGEIRDIEAKGGRSNTVATFIRPLYEPSCQQLGVASPTTGPQELPPPRSDIYVLRMKDRNSPGCPLNLEAH